jgi:HK97 family phage portal protein
MGLLDTFRRFKLSLSNHDRQTISKIFGSFHANQFAMNGNSFLQHGYEQNVDVYSVIKKIVDTSKKQKFIVEQKTSEGWEKLEDTSLHALMMHPNKSKGYTFEDILEMLLIYLLSNGNGILYGIKPAGFRSIEELDVLPSNHVEVKSKGTFFEPMLKYCMTLDNSYYKFETEDIGHIRFFNPLYSTIEDSFIGLSPIQVAAQVVQSGNDRWQADANLLQNRGAIGLISDRSNMPMLDTEADKIQAKFETRTAGVGNFGKTIVTNKDLNYIQMAMTPQDLQLVEKGVINLRAICSVFGIDSSLLNDPENKTFNNRKEAEKSLFTNAVMPTMDKIEAEFNRWLVPTHFPEGNVRMRVDYSDVSALQTDQKTEAEKDRIVLDGVKLILEMNTSAEGKAQLLSDIYDFSEEQIQSLIVQTNENID